MELVRHGEGLFRSPPAPDTPTVEVLFGGDGSSADLGVVRVTVPTGAGMPEHRHGGSDVVVMPVVGSVEITRGEERVLVDTGDAILIDKDEAVALRNAGDAPAQMIVAAGPAAFVDQVRAWPEPDSR